MKLSNAILCLSLLLAGGCCTARVKHTDGMTEVYGRILHTEKTTFSDGRVVERTTDTTTGNALDVTKTMLGSTLDAVSGFANRVGFEVGK